MGRSNLPKVPDTLADLTAMFDLADSDSAILRPELALSDELEALTDLHHREQPFFDHTWRVGDHKLLAEVGKSIHWRITEFENALNPLDRPNVLGRLTVTPVSATSLNDEWSVLLDVRNDHGQSVMLSPALLRPDRFITGEDTDIGSGGPDHKKRVVLALATWVGASDNECAAVHHQICYRMDSRLDRYEIEERISPEAWDEVCQLLKQSFARFAFYLGELKEISYENYRRNFSKYQTPIELTQFVDPKLAPPWGIKDVEKELKTPLMSKVLEEVYCYAKDKGFGALDCWGIKDLRIENHCVVCELDLVGDQRNFRLTLALGAQGQIESTIDVN